MIFSNTLATLLFILFQSICTSAFTGLNPFLRPVEISLHSNDSSSTKLQMNFFKDLLGDAFSNDPGLSSDKSEGQVDYKGEDDASQLQQSSNAQTDVQKRWLQSQQIIKKQQANNQREEQRSSSGGKGAPVNPDLLEGTKWAVDLYLAGVPNKDPSSDLYGSKNNVSSRDKSLPMGVTCPEEPSVVVNIEFATNGILRVEKSSFTSGEDGQWKLSDDNRFVRFSLDNTGFQRTVKTIGTITKVYWSKEDEATSSTSSLYSIPRGILYADTNIGYGLPGKVIMGEGLLRVEKTVGLLKIASKMITCGKFNAIMIDDETKNSGAI